METLMIFMAILLIAIVAEPLAEKLRVPFTALLALIGFIGSELLLAIGIDTGLRWETFNNLILHVFVPILVFESAFNMKARILLKNIFPVLFLAIPAMLFAAAVTGASIYYAIGHPVGFPWVTALICGVILSATDPVAVVALFKKLGAPDRLTVLLEGESLFNDATAIVLFSVLTAIALQPNQSISVTAVTSTFIINFCGGMLVGSACAALSNSLYHYLKSSIVRAVITVICACTAFYVAEVVLHLSGIMAVLLAGLLMGENHRNNATSTESFTAKLWDFFAYCSNALLFILAGVTITWKMFESHWLAMAIGICAAIFARSMVIYGLLPISTGLFRASRIPHSYRPVMLWGGLRGAVSLALALSIPVAVEGWYSAQSITYGVVLFTLFVQTPFMPSLVKKAAGDH